MSVNFKETLDKKINYPRVLLCSGNPYLFRTTTIGYLYEISQVFPVILFVLPELASEMKELLKDKKLFPKLEAVVIGFKLTGINFWQLLKNNRKYKNLIKKTIYDYRPEIIISDTDANIYELYMMRYGKKIKATNICFQYSLQANEEKEDALWSYMTNAYLKVPVFLPFWLRMFFVKLKKYAGHFFYYYILPVLNGEKPFFGKSSFILREGGVGLRDADFVTGFTRRDKKLFLKNGVLENKIYILKHPMARRKTRDFFQKALSLNLKGSLSDRKILTIMFPMEKIGFKRGNLSLIDKENSQRNKINIISLISEALPDWKIFLKLHPAAIKEKNFEKIYDIYKIGKNIEITDPLDPADKYIQISKVVVGIPPSSTTLFSASIQCPGKIILSIDLEKELLGDLFINFEGVEYINNEKDLKKILNLIGENKYQKEKNKKRNDDFSDYFSDPVRFLEFIIKK